MPSAVPKGQESYEARLQRYYKSGKFCDAVIKANSQTFNVHKVVLCGHSDYFEGLYGNEWLEAQTNEVVLREDGPGAVKAMVQYMYGFQAWWSGCKHEKNTTLFYARIFSVADKYLVPGLREEASRAFHEHVLEAWDEDHMGTLIQELYNVDTPYLIPSIKEAVLDVTAKSLCIRMKSERFRAFLQENPNFWMDVMHALAKDNDVPKWYSTVCIQCEKKTFAMHS